MPRTCLNLSDSTASGLSFPDDTLKKYRVFLLGELHGTACNPRIIIKLLKYLHENAGVNHFLIEQGMSIAFQFNKYLETGNEDYVLKQWDYRYNEYVSFWRELYRYNKAQPADKKIDVIGIDFEEDWAFAQMVECLKPSDKAPPPEMQPVLDSLHKLTTLGAPQSYVDNRLFNRFRDELLKNQAACVRYFGNNYYQLESICENKSSYKKFGKRNTEMAYNFLDLVDETDTVQKYFGSFGWSHTFVNYGSFAYYVGHPRELSTGNTTFESKVISIGMVYDSCFSFYKNKIFQLDNPILADFFGSKKGRAALNLFRSQADCPTALFTLPANRKELKALREQTPYVIYVKGQKAVTFSPFKKGY